MAGAEPQNETAATAAKSRSDTEVSQSAAEPSKKESQGAVESSTEERTTWRDNPNDCDLETQYVRKDNLECIEKPSTTNRTRAPQTASTPQRTSNCEQYRSLVSQYDWNTDVAMLVMEKESGCDPNAVGRTNDHGLFQLNGVRIYDPAENIAYAYHNKYVNSRVGSPRNWSSWYAVCTPGNNPQPKFPGVHCQ